MHRIDRHIFMQLLTQDVRRFSELKPFGVESNVLTYRLKSLAKEGFVRKTSDGRYKLTEQGRFFTDRLNLQRFTPRQMPRPVCLIVVRRGNEWLLHKRLIQPLRDIIGLPHTNIHSGESIITTAEKNLEATTGLHVKLAYRGGGYLTFYRGNELESFNQFNILENVTQPRGQLQLPKQNLNTGTYFWRKSPDFTSPDYLPSLKDFAKLLKKGTFPFFVELVYNLDKKN